MNRFFKQLIVVSALSLSFSSSALAEIEWGQWYVAPSIVYNDDDPDRVTDDSISGIQIVGGREFGYNYALEGSFIYSDIDGWYLQAPGGSYVRSSEPQLDVAFSVLAQYDRDAEFSPYGVLGIG